MDSKGSQEELEEKSSKHDRHPSGSSLDNVTLAIPAVVARPTVVSTTAATVNDNASNEITQQADQDEVKVWIEQNVGWVP